MWRAGPVVKIIDVAPSRRLSRLLAALLCAPVAAGACATPAGAGLAKAVHAAVVSGNPADWTPDVLDGAVEHITQVGGRVYLGGSFTKVRDRHSGQVHHQPYLVAIQAGTGVVDPAFAPRLDGTVWAMEPAPDARSLYVGGDFEEVDGVPTGALARLDAATGEPAGDFAAQLFDAIVYELRVVGPRLIVGGDFARFGKVRRRALAAVSPATGAVDDSLNLNLDKPRVSQSGARAPLRVTAFDVTPDGSRMVIVGSFTEVGGQSRTQIAVVNLGAQVTLARWSTARYAPLCSKIVPSYLRDVDISADGRWFVVVTSGSYRKGLLCDSAARWEFGVDGPDKEPTWVNHTGGDTLLSVAVTGSAVYVGGHQRWLDNPSGAHRAGPGSVPRLGIGAIDPASGKALSWNPGEARGVGTGALYPTATGLWIGSDTVRVGGERRERVAFFPLA